MPPSYYGPSPFHDTPAEVVPEPPRADRFTRSGLDATGQKIFDQLKQQRELIEGKVGADEAKKYYSDLTGLTKDESTALMAMELQSTGITDIYKVKQETQRIPVQMVTSESSEGGANYTTSFIDPSGQEARDPSLVKGDYKSGFYVERPVYTNTDTGQVINPNAGGPFSGREGILSDYSVGKRRDIGTGVKFTDDGMPIYYSEGEATPSSWKSFTNSVRPLLPIAAMLIPGIGQALQPFASSILGAGASQAAVGALAQGIASGVANTIATGEIGEGLKAGLLSGGLNYGLQAAQGINSLPYLDAPLATFEGLNLGEINAAAAGEAIPTLNSTLGDPTAALGGMPDTLLGFDNVEDLFGASNAALDLGSGANSLYPDDMETLLSGDVPAPSTPNWDTGYPTQPEVPLGSLAPTESGPLSALDAGMNVYTEPAAIHDPYMANELALDRARAGAAMTPAQVASATMHGAVSDPYMIHELAGLDAMATPPTFLDKVAAGLTAAGSTAVDKLLTPAGALSAATAVASMADLNNKNKSGGEGGEGNGSTGWSGIIPRYTAEREVIKDAFKRDPYAKTQTGIDAAGKPIYTPTPVMGRAFFKPLQYTPRPAPATPATNVNTQTPSEAPENMSGVITGAQGGIMALNEGRYLRGPSDGMSDELMTSIDGIQPAALSHGEFVIPADVVSHLGNGNSDAGAKVLHKMMDRVRHARTGTMRQGKQINPDTFMPGGIVQLSNGGSAGTTANSGGVTGASPVTTSSNLSGWAAPVVSENIGRMEALAQEEYTPYEGQLTATASPTQTKAFEAAQKLSDPSRKWSAETMKTYMNPYLEGIQAPQIKEYERQADIRQQGIQSQFARAGAFGGSRELLARLENERILEDQREKLLGRTAFEAYDKGADMYGRERDRDAADMLAMLKAGGDERAIEAEGITALRSEFDKQQNEPMRRLREFSDVLAKLPIEATTKKADLSTLDKIGLSTDRALGLYKVLRELFPDD